MKVIFAGTPEFAVPCLKALVERHAVLAVVTRPDQRQGRGMELAHSPVKTEALRLGLTVLQPQDVG